MTFNSKNPQKNEEIQESSFFSRSLSYLLKSFIIPFSEKENRESYEGQIVDVSHLVGSSLSKSFNRTIAVKKYGE